MLSLTDQPLSSFPFHITTAIKVKFVRSQNLRQGLLDSVNANLKWVHTQDSDKIFCLQSNLSKCFKRQTKILLLIFLEMAFRSHSQIITQSQRYATIANTFVQSTKSICSVNLFLKHLFFLWLTKINLFDVILLNAGSMLGDFLIRFTFRQFFKFQKQ